jgi:chitinase
MYANKSMLIPYVDTTLYPLIDFSSIPHTDGVCLGFVVADASKDPSWGGAHKVSSDFMDKRINGFKKKLVCSFGGAQGKELAQVCDDEFELFEKYKQVVERYDFKTLDFDIEGKALGDTKANDRRRKALKLLKKAFPKLNLQVTLPVSPSGLAYDAMQLVDDFEVVNIMAMDYGNVKQMGAAACEAATNAHKQTGKPIGITVMIGKNDTGEVFTLDDARQLQVFARANHWVYFLSFWSLHRDRGIGGSIESSSMVTQKPWEFSFLLND